MCADQIDLTRCIKCKYSLHAGESWLLRKVVCATLSCTIYRENLMGLSTSGSCLALRGPRTLCRALNGHYNGAVLVHCNSPSVMSSASLRKH